MPKLSIRINIHSLKGKQTLDRSGFSSSEKVSNFYLLSTANIINVGKTLKFSLVYWEENKEAILTASIDYWTEVPKQCTNAGKSSKKREKIGKKKQKFYYFWLI